MWKWFKQLGKAPPAPAALPLHVPQTGTDTDVPALTISAQQARQLALSVSPNQRGRPRGASHECDACGAPLAPVLLTTWGTAAWDAVPVAADGWCCTRCGNTTAPALLTPAQVDTLCQHGAAAGQAGRLDEAEFYFRRVCDSWSTYSVARMQLGSVYLDRLQREAADQQRPERLALYEERALMELLAASSGAPQAMAWVHIQLARLLIARGDDEQATVHLRHLAAHPDATDEQAEYGRQLAADIQHGTVLFERGTQLIQPYITLHDRPVSDSDTAQASLRKGAAMLATFAKRNPDHWPCLWFLGKAHEALAEMDTALAWMAACWALQPPNPDVGREYSLALMINGQLTEAVAVQRQTLALAPEDAGLLSNLALGLLLVGRDSEATRFIRAARTADPDDPICTALETLLQDVQCGVRPRPIGMGPGGALQWPQNPTPG